MTSETTPDDVVETSPQRAVALQTAAQTANESEKKTRRERLIDSARALFFKHGYSATRMIDVARNAGFSKRTVYLEFESKDELFATICEEGVDLLLRRLEETERQEHPVIQALLHLAKAYFAFFREEPAYFRLLFAVADDENLAKANPDSFARLRQKEIRCVECITRQMRRAQEEGLMRSDIDAWMHSIMAWAALTGCLTSSKQSRRLEPSASTVAAIYWQCLEALMRGVATEQGLAGV